ncbi:MAG: phosphate ABC transporter substrate-binding protein [Chlorobi bacterium OLB7]|nr:MAG: phosphate ABC transporter substrate-binding protein [Chlorobi bacterium OLB7]
MTSFLNKGIVVGAMALMAMGCGGAEKKEGKAESKKQVITQKGSDTMILLGQQWAEKFGAANPDIQVQVTGGGSGTGISSLINGTTDLCNSSRPMKDQEKEQIKQKFGADPVEIPVAKDALSVYVNEGSKVQSLTLEQLYGIYTGKVTNWKDVGGADAKIILYGRENSSGTYEYFKEHVLKKEDFAPETQTLSGTAAVVNAVSKDPNGIGYGGAAFSKGIREISIAGTDGTPVAPTKENVYSGTYPLARSLYIYLRQQPTGQIKQYLDWILGPEGQAIVTNVGYYPIKQ